MTTSTGLYRHPREGGWWLCFDDDYDIENKFRAKYKRKPDIVVAWKGLYWLGPVTEKADGPSTEFDASWRSSKGRRKSNDP